MLITVISVCVCWGKVIGSLVRKLVEDIRKLNKFCALPFCEINISLKKTNLKPVRYKKKKYSKKDLLNFLIALLIRVLLKHSFLKQHKTDLKQYSLSPTSTANISTCPPLDSMIIFKAKHLLILVPSQDSIFCSQGHVSLIRITFLKLFKKIVI